MKHYFLDTNMLVRFLTGEPEKQAEKVRELMQENERERVKLTILPLVVAEAVFVLTGSVYRLKRANVSSSMRLFLESSSLEVVDRDALLESLRLFGQTRVDFVDAYLSAKAIVEEKGVATFDRDFRKFDGVVVWPE